MQVHLLGLPVQARFRFTQHLEELTRELSLIHIGAQQGSEESLPLRLLQIASELEGPYAVFRATPDAVAESALVTGEEFCDVTYSVPPTAGEFLQVLGRVLEEADDFCRGQQHLLSLPASQEVAAYRRWFVAESVRQLAGEAPRPWRPRPGAPVEREPSSGQALPAVAAPSSRPLGTGEVVERPMVMESMASSVAAARRYVREVLRRVDAEDLEESAELCVSELVTNAVLHARTAFSLAVRTMDGGRLRIEVTDSSPAAIQPRHFAVTSTTGRGLQLVASLSWDWGVESLPAAQGPGKVVWFEPREFDPAAGFAEQEWALDLEALL